MENKLAITIVALMVAALAVPAVMAEDVGYSATVTTAANVVVTQGPTGFENVLAGETKTLADSLSLKNDGNAPAKVEAKFTTVDGDYGLTGDLAGNVIPGTKFKLDGKALKATDAQTEITAALAADATVTYDAELAVPAGQAADTYTGNVLLTFTTVTV